MITIQLFHLVFRFFLLFQESIDPNTKSALLLQGCCKQVRVSCPPLCIASPRWIPKHNFFNADSIPSPIKQNDDLQQGSPVHLWRWVASSKPSTLCQALFQLNSCSASHPLSKESESWSIEVGSRHQGIWDSASHGLATGKGERFADINLEKIGFKSLRADLIFVKKFTRPDFRAENFTH